MKVRTLGLCLAVLGVAITASRANAAPAPHCANAWASLPQLNANPAYESPNDPDLTYRDRVVRTIGPYGVWANELGRAARNFVQIRETLAIWSNRLSAAERKFWTDFDADGRVQQSSIDELAYWFHKREVWGNYRANVSASMSQTLGGDAGALTKFLLGGDSDLAFLPPGVVTAGFGPSPQPTIEASFADAAYKTYLTQLLQNSFLRLSECAPRKDGTPSGRVLDQLLRPSYSVDQVRSMWSEVTSWAKSKSGAMEMLDEVISGTPLAIRQSRSAWSIATDVMAGKISSAADVIYESFRQHTQRLVVMGNIRPQHVTKTNNGFSFVLTNEELSPAGSVVIKGVTFDNVETCVAENWDAIRRYYFDKTSDYTTLFHSPSPRTRQYAKHLAYVAVIGCGSADGLDDERVANLIASFANKPR